MSVPVCCVQVDFSSVVKRKLDAVSRSSYLQQCIGEWKCVNSEFIASERYCAIGCDINNLSALHCILEKAGVDFSAPTLFLSECVLTYINPNRYVIVMQCPLSYILFSAVCMLTAENSI